MSLESQNIIVALIIVLIPAVMYLLLRVQKKEQTSDHLLVTGEEISPQTTSQTQEQTEQLSQPKIEKKRKSDLKKRDIPLHGKITKGHFKEFSGMRILVAEDNLINQKVIAGLLAESGIELVMANDGAEALEILAKDQNFLIVLMDAHMPNMDGFEATRIIRQTPLYDNIVVVALSGDVAPDDIEKMSEAGMQEHLEKPLRMETLYDILYAYSGPQKHKESDANEFVEVPMTSELEGEKGLAICGGDETFYKEILKEFVTMYADSAQRLREMLLNGDEIAADKLLLDVIGVAANIGAQRFTESATELKDGLIDRDEKSYFSYLEHYQTHLERLVEDIKNFL